MKTKSKIKIKRIPLYLPGYITTFLSKKKNTKSKQSSAGTTKNTMKTQVNSFTNPTLEINQQITHILRIKLVTTSMKVQRLNGNDDKSAKMMLYRIKKNNRLKYQKRPRRSLIIC
jgi:hypothetical protein